MNRQRSESHGNASDYYPRKYEQAADLQARENTGTIDKVVPEDFTNDGIKTQKPVLDFRGTAIKPVVLNKTNYLILSKLFGDDDSEWAGKKVTLGTELVNFQGKAVELIRVKKPAAAPPKEEEEQPPEDDGDPDDDPNIPEEDRSGCHQTLTEGPARASRRPRRPRSMCRADDAGRGKVRWRHRGR